MKKDSHHFKGEGLPRSKKVQRKDAWKQFVIPTKKKQENVSDRVDEILFIQKDRS